MTDELVKRLRGYAMRGTTNGDFAMREAADALERLQAERDRAMARWRASCEEGIAAEQRAEKAEREIAKARAREGRLENLAKAAKNYVKHSTVNSSPYIRGNGLWGLSPWAELKGTVEALAAPAPLVIETVQDVAYRAPTSEAKKRNCPYPAQGRCTAVGCPLPECPYRANTASETERRVVEAMLERVEKLAFEMPPPNSYTPRFVQLVVECRHALAAHQQGEG